jgi:hypothetical protein
MNFCSLVLEDKGIARLSKKSSAEFACRQIDAQTLCGDPCDENRRLECGAVSSI